jgi:hypothetical protein
VIGRFARSLGWKPHAPIVAGAILVVLGVWQGGEPLFASYPEAGDLEPVTGTGGEVVELNVQSAGLPIFESGPLLECRAILEPGDRPVLYRSILPDDDAVQQALAGEVTVMMWESASEPFDRTMIWGISAGGTTLVAPSAVVEALRAWRADRIILGACLAGVGLVCIGFGIYRWSSTPREGLG